MTSQDASPGRRCGCPRAFCRHKSPETYRWKVTWHGSRYRGRWCEHSWGEALQGCMLLMVPLNAYLGVLCVWALQGFITAALTFVVISAVFAILWRMCEFW